jgi:hypothetical protein
MVKNNNSINASYYDYVDNIGPNLPNSFNYPIAPNLTVETRFDSPSPNSSNNRPINGNNFPQNSLSNEDYFSMMTYSSLSTSPFNSLPHTNNNNHHQQLQQQPSVLLNSISSSFENASSSYVSHGFILPPKTKVNFRNKFINENMINTPLEQDIYSRLWFTYRKDFLPLDGNPKYTSDCGWGCMLRSGQMLLAQALMIHHFDMNWSLFKSLKNKKDLQTYRDILSLFNDRPQMNECPFGLHNMLQIADEHLKNSQDKIDQNQISTNTISAKNNGSTTGKKLTSRVGTWFGPTAVCTLLRDALNRTLDYTNNDHFLLKNLRIYVAQDCTIFKNDVLKLCMKKKDSDDEQVVDDSAFIPCVILVSVRLGGDSINKIYYDSLKMFLKMAYCIGIVGGKPKHSLYFIGYQGKFDLYF